MKQTKKMVSANNVINSAGLAKQADRMLRGTVKHFPELSVGDNVTLKIPNVDKTRVDLPNLLGIIMEVRGICPMYKVGTRSGILQSFYNRKELTLTKEEFLKIEDVPRNPTDVRKAASDASLFGGQGLQHCICKGSCEGDSCGCRKKGLLCISRCHSKNTKCKNLD